MIALRAGTCADVTGIAKVHVDSWRTTYRDLMPADFLANLSYKQRESNWKDFMWRNQARICLCSRK